jgi:hypothetical protein
MRPVLFCCGRGLLAELNIRRGSAMLTDTDIPNLKKPEPAAPPQPYVKPAVERVPLNEAQLELGPFDTLADLTTLSS